MPMPSPVTMPPSVLSRKTRPRTAGGDDDRLGFDHVEFAGPHFDRYDALATAVFFEQINAEMLVETLNRGILDRGLEQGVQDVETGFVGGKPSPFDFHAAKGAHIDMAVFGAAPRTAPVFKLGQFLRCLLDEVLNDVLFAQPVATAHGIVKVIIQTVGRLLDALPHRLPLPPCGCASDRPSKPARS